MNIRSKLREPAVILGLAVFGTLAAQAQDPTLPPTDLGVANVFDGVVPKAKFIYQCFTQDFQPGKLYDDRGKNTGSSLKIGSLLVINQFIYLSPVKVFDGVLGFTALIPVVQISSSNLDGAAPVANPNVFGDIISGVCIQWSDHKLFGKPFSHRGEFDITAPTGAYESRYGINPSAHLWTYSVYHAFTIILNDKVSISSRNRLNYNTHIDGTQAKPGAFYNGNYSVDYSVFKNLKVEVAAYYLAQLNQDSFDGNSRFYQDEYGLATTKEHVLGYGPGLVFFAPGGILFEAKTFFETDVQNRFSGTRPTLRIAVPLSK